MARNVEIKARITGIDMMREKVAALADNGPWEIRQEDTFFRCFTGRLKLRVSGERQGQLIFYRRSDEKGPKESAYEIYPTTDPDKLRQVLYMAYGEAGRVRKHRTLYRVGRTRIHLDQVDGLGHFLELEVVLDEGEPAEVGVAVAHELLEKLGISPDQLVDKAYFDLM